MAKGELQVVQCQREDVFLVARVRNAGICKVLDTKPDADAFVLAMRGEQNRLGWPE